MTRESRAKWMAAATTALVVLLAASFAVLRNLPAPVAAAPSARTPASTDGTVDADRIVTGQRAYARLGCANCHSIAGRGNPSNPLDGVGARLDRKALLELTTGTGAAREALGAGLARRKASAVGDPDLDALIDYLAQLK